MEHGDTGTTAAEMQTRWEQDAGTGACRAAGSAERGAGKQHKRGSGSVRSRRGCTVQTPGAQGCHPQPATGPNPARTAPHPPGQDDPCPHSLGPSPGRPLPAAPQPLRSRPAAASRPARCRPRSPRRPLRPAEDAAVADAVPPRSSDPSPHPGQRPQPPGLTAGGGGASESPPRRGPPRVSSPPGRSRSLRPDPMSSRRGGKRSHPAWGKRRDPGSLRLPPPRRPPPAPAEPLRHRAEPPAAAWPRYALPRCPCAVAASVPASRLTCRAPGRPRTALRGPRPRRRAALLGGQGINGEAGRSLRSPSPSQATVKSPITGAVTRANLSLCANTDCVWFCISFPRTPNTSHRSIGSHCAPVISLSSFRQQTPAGQCSELPGQGSALRALGMLQGSLGCPGTDEAIKHSFIYQIKKICCSVSAKLPLVLSTFFPGKLEHRGLLFFK